MHTEQLKELLDISGLGKLFWPNSWPYEETGQTEEVTLAKVPQ